MQYQVICVERSSNSAMPVICELNAKVNELLKCGWKVQGGVSISKVVENVSLNNVTIEWSYCASQAMIKE